MIDLFVKAWDENNKLLLKEFETTIPDGYQDIVKKLISIVINPYLYKIKPKYPESDGLDIDSMTIIDDGDYIKLELNIPKFKIYQLDETSRFILYYIYTYEGAFDEKTLDGYHLKISQIRKHQESYDAKIQEKIINCPIILNAMILLNLVNANLYVIDVDPINENVTIQVGESRLIGTKGACSLNENAIFRNFSLGGNTEESFYQTTTSVVVSLVKD